MLKLLLCRIVSQPYSTLLPAPLYEILGGALTIIQTNSNRVFVLRGYAIYQQVNVVCSRRTRLWQHQPDRVRCVSMERLIFPLCMRLSGADQCKCHDRGCTSPQKAA